MLDAEQMRHCGLVFAGHGQAFGCPAMTVNGLGYVHRSDHAMIAQQIRKPNTPRIWSISVFPIVTSVVGLTECPIQPRFVLLAQPSHDRPRHKAAKETDGDQRDRAHHARSRMAGPYLT